MGEATQIQPEIINLQALLEQPKVCIPNYQRPYKWSTKNVNQLIDDLITFKEKPAYRLGTIVYYSENENLEIVDGQQRSITLMLIHLAIQRSEKLQELIKLNNFNLPNTSLIAKLEFKNQISKRNIRDNFNTIERRILDFDLETVLFFYRKCEVVKVVLKDISEAFQFFDSQNARGVDLDPHDLLKAFHLREMMDNTSEIERTKTVENWENIDNNKLKNSFSNYLFRIRNWSNAKSARHFSKSDADIFKGISPHLTENYPFADIYRISHFYVKGYNESHDRSIDRNKMEFPFQLDQVIINGQRFFEMIDHYIDEIYQLKNLELKNTNKILSTLNNNGGKYYGKNRTGDRYVRNLFDCALIFYLDKFGFIEIERAIEKLFIWAYTIRLTKHSVQLASIDNHALAYPYVFKAIKDALQPNDVLNIQIPSIKKGDLVDSDKTKVLKEIFIELKYINE